MFDIIIIGAGVAGLTAAIYASRASKSVLVIEEKVVGGQIVQSHDIRNWPGAINISGQSLTRNMLHQVQRLGVKITYDTVKNVAAQDSAFTIHGSEKTYQTKSLIIATGSHDKPLDCKNEAKYVGHGLSYCVTCDGALYKNQDVAVIGGGNTAFYDVLYLADIARKIYLVHRRQAFRADAALVEKVKKLDNVEFVLGAIPHDIKGNEKVEKLVLVENTSDDNSSNTPFELNVSAIFAAIGREPNTQIFHDLVNLDQSGYIIADETCQTSCQGIFVAGDCRTKELRQLVTAASDGAIAATAAVNYLNQS